MLPMTLVGTHCLPPPPGGEASLPSRGADIDPLPPTFPGIGASRQSMLGKPFSSHHEPRGGRGG